MQARLFDDDELRADLSRRGLARAADFTWSRNAREVAAMYRDALAIVKNGGHAG